MLDHKSSPQAWGCFLILHGRFIPALVFPTGVGVFPLCTLIYLQLPRLPHRRGGVSTAHQREVKDLESSPQAWGCFRPRAVTCIFG